MIIPFYLLAIVSQVEINSRPSKLSRFFKGIGLDDAASPPAANSAEKKWALEKSVFFKSSGANQLNSPPAVVGSKTVWIEYFWGKCVIYDINDP